MSLPVDATKPIDLLETPAVKNLARGEAAGLKVNIKDANKRTNRLKAWVIAGVIWSFIYAAITLSIMVSVIHQTNGVCRSLQESRETVREILVSVPELDFSQDELIAALPPVEC